MLVSNSRQTSFLFEVSGAPSSPKSTQNWNHIVGTIINNLKEFNSQHFAKNLENSSVKDLKAAKSIANNSSNTNEGLRKRTLPENINPKPYNFDDSDAASKIMCDGDQTLNVKVFSVTGQPRILSSTMLRPDEMAQFTAKNEKAEQKKDEVNKPEEKKLALWGNFNY